jgi:hypothetical protein
LKPGDLICIYTDGFIKLTQNFDFVKGLREQELSFKTYDFIKEFALKLEQHKEKNRVFYKA